MPWNDNAGGGGGGPWGSGGGRKDDNNPWGRGPGGGRGRGPGGEPDLEDLIRNLQDRLRGLFGGGKGKGGKGGGIGIGVIAAGLLAVWVGATGWYIVAPNEAGVVLRFGEYDRTTTPGFKLKLPYPIEQVRLPEVTTTQSVQIGSDQRGVTMLTEDENIVDLGFTVQWRVKYGPDFPDGVRNYLFNVRDVDGAVRAVAESAMREVVGTTALEPIITQGRVEVSQRTRQLMQEVLDEYEAGVQILNVNLQRAQAPEQVIDAFRDVDAAAQDAERMRLEATAYANSVIPQARGEAARLIQSAQGYRESVIAEAQGQADRFVAIYQEYAQAPEVTRRRMYLETMERVLGGSELIILDQQGGAVPYLPLDRLGRDRVLPDQTTSGSNTGGR